MNVPQRVQEAYGLVGGRLAAIDIGLVNRTYAATRADGTKLILQRLHPTFAGEVNLDLDAVTRHLADKGVPTPRLVRTESGAPFVVDDGTYRALTFLEGTVHETVASPAIAFEAGALAGRFHAGISDLEHVFAFVRPGAHDTHAHLAKLERVLASRDDFDVAEEARALALEILLHGRAVADPVALPPRIIHGDLKITNLLFEADGVRGKALLDLDTLQLGTLETELGDAMRSWTNPLGESSSDAYCDLDVFREAMRGYAGAVAGFASEAELASVPRGLVRIASELACRFVVDVFEDAYFGWDAARYPSRRAHNLARARSQLALARDALRKLPELTALAVGTV